MPLDSMNCCSYACFESLPTCSPLTYLPWSSSPSQSWWSQKKMNSSLSREWLSGHWGHPAGLNCPCAWGSCPCAAALAWELNPSSCPGPSPCLSWVYVVGLPLPRGLARLAWPCFIASPCLMTAGLLPEPVTITKLALFGLIWTKNLSIWWHSK